MYYPTPAQMKLIEEFTDKNSISYKKMMENAGDSVSKHICDRFMDSDFSRKVVILCGNGNNAGDGFVIANNLAMLGVDTALIMLKGEPKTPLAKEKYDELEDAVSFGKVRIFHDFNAESIISADIIVDAVFGTGFSGAIPKEIAEVFSIANKKSATKIAVDIPSGGNSLTGEFDENSFKADVTITFGYKKIGMKILPLKNNLGELFVEDIGFSPDAINEIPFIPCEICEDEILAKIPPRTEDGYKNNYGHLLNVAGSFNMSGAAALSTLSALRSGAGLVTLATTKDVINRVGANIYECMFLPMKATTSGNISKENAEAILKFSEKCNAISIGCGLGNSKDSCEIVKEVLEKSSCNIILDADGINSILSCIDIIKCTKNKLVITPHLGELKRIYTAYYNDGTDVDRLTMAITLSRELGIIIVAKGVPTFIVGDGKVVVLKAGNAGLSKGGSGDVLTGIISAMVARGISLFDSAVLGVFLHGKSADITAEKSSYDGMLPSDVIENLPFVF